MTNKRRKQPTQTPHRHTTTWGADTTAKKAYRTPVSNERPTKRARKDEIPRLWPANGQLSENEAQHVLCRLYTTRNQNGTRRICAGCLIETGRIENHYLNECLDETGQRKWEDLNETVKLAFQPFETNGLLKGFGCYGCLLDKHFVPDAPDAEEHTYGSCGARPFCYDLMSAIIQKPEYRDELDKIVNKYRRAKGLEPAKYSCIGRQGGESLLGGEKKEFQEWMRGVMDVTKEGRKGYKLSVFIPMTIHAVHVSKGINPAYQAGGDRAETEVNHASGEEDDVFWQPATPV